MVNIPLFTGFHTCWVQEFLPSTWASMTRRPRHTGTPQLSCNRITWLRGDQVTTKQPYSNGDFVDIFGPWYSSLGKNYPGFIRHFWRDQKVLKARETWYLLDTVDGWNPALVDLFSLSHYLQGFTPPRWLAGFLKINWSTQQAMEFPDSPPFHRRQGSLQKHMPATQRNRPCEVELRSLILGFSSFVFVANDIHINHK